MIDDPKFEVRVSSDFRQIDLIDDDWLLKLEDDVIIFVVRILVVNQDRCINRIGDPQAPFLVLIEPSLSIGSKRSVPVGVMRTSMEVVGADVEVNNISIGTIIIGLTIK